MSVLFTGANSGDIADATAYQANWNLLESSLGDFGPLIISGLVPTIGTGLSVNISSGVADINGEITPAAFTISSLAPSSTNHLYLLQNGTGTSNTTGTAPALSVKLGTCITGAASVTSVATNWASGRQAKVRTENLVMGSGAGNPRSLNLASWAAAGNEGQECVGVLPVSAQAAQSLGSLSDVSLTGTAQGDVLFRGASAWNNLAHGAAGNTLQSGGAAANPSWSALNLAGGANFVTGILPDANLPADIPYTDVQSTWTVTQTIAPAAGTHCLVLTANGGGGLNMMQSAGGTKRVLIALNGVMQFGTDAANNGTADFWFQNVGSGNNVLTVSATDLVTIGSNNASGGAILGTATGRIGFYAVGTPVAKQTLTGVKSGGTALANLITALANLGLLTDSTT